MPRLLYADPFFRGYTREDLWREQEYAKLQRARQLEMERERERRLIARRKQMEALSRRDERMRLEQQRAEEERRRRRMAKQEQHRYAYEAALERRERLRAAEMERRAALQAERNRELDRLRKEQAKRREEAERQRLVEETRRREAMLRRQNEAATRLQALWSGHVVRQQKLLPGLRQLRSLEEKVWGIREKYSSALQRRTTNEPSYWGTPQTGPYQMEILGYEDELMRQLCAIDAVQTNGSAILRRERKQLVALVQNMLSKEVDGLKALSERLGKEFESMSVEGEGEWEDETTEGGSEEGEEPLPPQDEILSWLEEVFSVTGKSQC